MLQFPLLLIKLLTTSFFVSKNRTVNGVKKKNLPRVNVAKTDNNI